MERCWAEPAVHSALPTKNSEIFVFMDSQRHELKKAGLYVEHGIIRQAAKTEGLPSTADTVLDLSDQFALPRLVNAHHYLNQILVRNLPAAQNDNRRDPGSLFIRNGQRLSLSSQ
jgi:8-oxoguanine deaminase